jgi:DNA polymerase-3 subunit alpha
MAQYFTHLHVHTEFSLLDGAISHKALIDFAKQYNIPAIGTSDHGNIFGSVKFFKAAQKAGIKPILGMEAYITEDARIKDQQNRYYHILIIVQNKVGYKNLCKLLSFSYQQGFYFKPRIDYEILAKHSEGLIVTSACLGGHIPQLLLQDKQEQAQQRIDWFLEHFGKDRFYLEVQPEDQAEQKILNQKLYDISAQQDIKCIVGCDAHYASIEDRQAHEVMLAIQTHSKMSDADRFSFGEVKAYLRSPEEICALFKDHLDAVYNTGVVADSCEFSFETGKLFFPKFIIPSEHTPITYFKHLCWEGFDRLLKEGRITEDQKDRYTERLNKEIELIVQMGFTEYFLVVSDFIQWAYRNGIPVGPGRGSAAGSLVAWTLQITNLDPLKYNLLFERFLNPERISMPDIDIDFCIEGREKVINYVKDKYGHDKVCQIITFGTMMAKGVIKDVARALGIPFDDSNMLTGLVPDQLKITLKEAIEQEPRLKELVEHNENVKNLFDIAYRLEGLTRHASKHAAGIVISPEPIDEVLPVYIPPKTDELVTQYDMTELEYLGFLKIDFLGLKNLTLIKRTLALIERNHGIKLDINALPIDDEKSFQLLCAGKTTGVFQLESEGLKDVLRKLQPEKFEDIIAVNALYRPGPLGSGMVDDFIERRHGRQEIKYLFPEIKPILEETYGVIVYQEQVMKIASTVAGYTLGQADILRRAMGKKKVEVMVEQRALFLEGAKKRGFDEQKAGELFDLMAYFAGYGFNKSHSAAYALIAYQTAYFKSHFPAEFMTCLISLESGNPDAMVMYLQEAKSMGIKIIQPDINTSSIEFDAVDGAIIFGLQGIKNVGLAALNNIMEVRNKKQFTDLVDFCTRVDLRTVNKRVIESLICSGAFDTLPGSRAQKFNDLAKIMETATERKKELQTGQTSLFGSICNREQKEQGQTNYTFSSCTEWTDKEKLEREKDVTGFYVSEHPLSVYQRQLTWFNVKPFDILPPDSTGKEQVTTGCGLLKTRKDIVTKKGERMAFIQLEELNGTTAEIVVFPKLFKVVEQWLSEYQVFIVKGTVDCTSDKICKIKAETLVPIDLIFEQWPRISDLTIELPEHVTDSMLKQIQTLLTPGPVQLQFAFNENNMKLLLETHEKIKLTFGLLEALSKQPINIHINL